MAKFYSCIVVFKPREMAAFLQNIHISFEICCSENCNNIPKLVGNYTNIFISTATGCNGGDDCCINDGESKCGEGEGDCDGDEDCQPGLFCGQDNCIGFGPSFDKSDDCCTKKRKFFPQNACRTI